MRKIDFGPPVDASPPQLLVTRFHGQPEGHFSVLALARRPYPVQNVIALWYGTNSVVYSVLASCTSLDAAVAALRLFKWCPS